MNRTIYTAEELEALPNGSVVLLPSVSNAAIKDENGDWAVGGHPRPFTSEKVHKGLHGSTATLLHEGVTR